MVSTKFFLVIKAFVRAGWMNCFLGNERNEVGLNYELLVERRRVWSIILFIVLAVVVVNGMVYKGYGIPIFSS